MLIRKRCAARYRRRRSNPAALKVRDFYRSQGRLTTEVDPKATSRSDGKVEIVFAIKEGGITKIDSIIFVGNRAFSERQLRDVVTTSQSGWFDVVHNGAIAPQRRFT